MFISARALCCALTNSDKIRTNREREEKKMASESQKERKRCARPKQRERENQHCTLPCRIAKCLEFREQMHTYVPFVHWFRVLYEHEMTISRANHTISFCNITIRVKGSVLDMEAESRTMISFSEFMSKNAIP